MQLERGTVEAGGDRQMQLEAGEDRQMQLETGRGRWRHTDAVRDS